MTLLRSRRVVERACNVVKNPAFARASATTRDAFGLRVLDNVAAPEARRVWPARITTLLKLPIPEFEAAMAEQPVRRSQIPKANGGLREIAIPTFERRCVSNALNDVLASTSEAVLPRCVRAYRAGHENAVRDAILDAAETVIDGRVRFYAKLDISSYFSEMPWEAIENALHHFGYLPDFIARVMAVVRCPVVRKESGRSISEPNTKGAQMGLAESAALANLVPFELDRALGSESPRLIYMRYSDDIFIGGAVRHEIVAAVRKVAAWCHKHGMRLKGIDHNTRLANLVRDVKKKKIELLGAEIDHLGHVHMPAAKLAEKLAELEFMHQRCAFGQIHGTSRYGNGGGVHAFDIEDLRRSAQAFLDYWSALDPRGTERARAIIKERFLLTSVASSTERGTVWAAQLWGAQTDREAGSGLHGPTIGASMRTRTSPSATGEGGSGASLLEPEEGTSEGERADAMDTNIRILPLSEHRHHGLTADSSLHEGFDHSVHSDVNSHPYGDEDLHLDPNRHKSEYRFETSSDVDLEVKCWDDHRDHDNARSVDPGVGAVGDPAEGAPPPRPVFENDVIRFVHTIVVKCGTEYVVLVGRCDLTAGIVSRVHVREVHRARPEAVLVRQMIDELKDERQSTMLLGMEDSWLAKTLLQPRRRFRAPILYGGVLELHSRARSRCVTLLGGLALPNDLRVAMQHERDALVRQQALLQAGFNPA